MQCAWAKGLCGLVLAASGLISWSTACASSSTSQEAQFDEEQLKSLGIGLGVAEYFRHGARFSPGRQTVDVVVNGVGLGKINATFNVAGQLCFTKEFTGSIGLVDIEESILHELADPSCADYRAFSPRSILILKPADMSVDITVPAENLVPVVVDEKFESGGVGAMLNYRAYATQSKSTAGTRTSSKYLDLQAGINADDWIFRSDQSLSVDGDVQSFDWSGASAKKSFVEHGKVLQIGRINLQDPIFGGLPINGLQWIPESAARVTNTYAVTGMALTRSTVEIRQDGVLLLKTIVPPGAFSLSDYPLRNSFNDLQVNVVGDTGATHTFTVPATLLMQSYRKIAVSGLHLSAGKLWSARQGSNRVSPFVGTASKGWNVESFSGTNGLLLSPGYASFGTQLNVALSEAGTHAMFMHATTTHDFRDSAHGFSTGGGLTSQLHESFSAGASLNVRGGDYRALQQAASRDPNKVSMPAGTSVQSSLSANWTNAWIGGIGASLSQENSALGVVGRTLSLGWSANWRGASFGLGLSHSISRSKSADAALVSGAADGAGNTYFYANLSIPLSSLGSIRNHLRYQGGSGQVGASFGTQLQQLAQVSMSTDRNFGESDTYSHSISVSSVPRYTSVNIGTTQSASSSSFYGSANGSIVATRSGIALSPHEAQDSFGIATTGDVKGVQLDTPGGSVWSGPFGLAAVPSYTPYRESRVEVATSSVGLDIEIDRSLVEVKASRGAVVDLDLGMRRVRRVVLTVKDVDGGLLPAGASIVGEHGEMLAVSLARGKVLVENLYDDSVLYAEHSQGRKCRFEELKFLGKQGDQLFESGTAVCVNMTNDNTGLVEGSPRK